MQTSLGAKSVSGWRESTELKITHKMSFMALGCCGKFVLLGRLKTCNTGRQVDVSSLWLVDNLTIKVINDTKKPKSVFSKGYARPEALCLSSVMHFSDPTVT